MVEVEKRRELSVATIDGEHVLREIVSADAEEIDVSPQHFGDGHGGRRLQHRAHQAVAACDPIRIQLAPRLRHHRPYPAHLFHRVHHRHQEADRAVGGGPQDRPYLAVKQLGDQLVDAHAAPAEERVLLGNGRQKHGKLVTAQVESADGHRPR